MFQSCTNFLIAAIVFWTRRSKSVTWKNFSGQCTSSSTNTAQQGSRRKFRSLSATEQEWHRRSPCGFWRVASISPTDRPMLIDQCLPCIHTACPKRRKSRNPKRGFPQELRRCYTVRALLPTQVIREKIIANHYIRSLMGYPANFWYEGTWIIIQWRCDRIINKCWFLPQHDVSPSLWRGSTNWVEYQIRPLRREDALESTWR